MTARDWSYMFLIAADDLDFCIDDLAGFNAEVLAQVREEYKRQQQVRFEAFLTKLQRRRREQHSAIKGAKTFS